MEEIIRLIDTYWKFDNAVSKRDSIEREALLRDYTDWLWINHNILTNANSNEVALKQYLSRNSC